MSFSRGSSRAIRIALTGLTLAVAITAFVVPAAQAKVDRQILLAQRVGFGAAAKGGDNQPGCTVTSNADTAALGTLRSCVALAASDDGRWISFGSDMTIALKKALVLPSRTTIDGRGANVHIVGGNLTTDGIVIDNVGDVIVENIALTNFGDVTKTDCCNDPWDSLKITNGAHDVWVDHVTFGHTGDKAVSISDGTHGVTLSWNAFSDQKQNVQIGNQTTAATDSVQTVTMHHNYFDGGYRFPALSHGRLHSYNNYLTNWSAFAVRSERFGQAYLENNVFSAGPDSSAQPIKFTPQGDGCNDNGTNCDGTNGYIKSVGNIGNILASRANTQNQPELVFDPHTLYAYTADDASTVAVNVSSFAGRQNIPNH